MDFISDGLKLNDNVTLSNLPMGIPLQDWRQEGYHPMMAIGLGTNSSVLNALKSGKEVLSRTWSMFHGWTGASSRTQHDGTFVFGGYDRAKVSGRGYSMSMTNHDNCGSQLMVTIGDILLNFPNGTTASLFETNTRSFSACITPDYPVLMTIPLEPYFRKFQSLTETDIVARTGGLAYYSMLYDGDEPYRGDLTIQLQSGPAIRIPNHQLIVPDRHIDEDTAEWTANMSAPNLILNPVQDVNRDDMPILGRQFLSSAYIMVNQDAGEFTLWSGNPTNAVDLVAVDENGQEVTDFCNDGDSPSPSQSTTSPPASSVTGSESEESEGDDGPPIGLIAGVAAGGAVLIIAIAALVFLFCRRRRRRQRAALDQGPGPAQDQQYDTAAYGLATRSPSELPQNHYPKDGYYKPELHGTTPSPSPSNLNVHNKHPQERHFELAG